MMKNNDIQSRRQFFKKAAKGALPILGTIALTQMPFLSQAHESQKEMGCRLACSGKCMNSCGYNCAVGCAGTCLSCCYNDACKAFCKMSCIQCCRGTCGKACDGSCAGTAYMKNDTTTIKK